MPCRSRRLSRTAPRSRRCAGRSPRSNASCARSRRDSSKEFPDYAALASPKPLKAEEVQTLLGADEALVFFLTGDEESPVFALTREGFEWKSDSARRRGAGAEGRRLSPRSRCRGGRRGRPRLPAKPELFDLGVAHELYGALLGPVEALIKDKHHLLVVPVGRAHRRAVPPAGDRQAGSGGARVQHPRRSCRLSRRRLADQAPRHHRAALGREPQGAARVRPARARPPSR